MAERDGTIVIDTQIDTDGIQAGSKEAEARIRNLAKKVNDIGATAKAALNKQIDAFAKLNNEYAAQEQKVENLRKKVAEYGNQKIPTDEYREIQTQIEQATAKLNRLKEAQERYIAGGGKTNSNTYRRQAYDMEELANTIKYAEAELKTLEATGQAFKTATGTKEAMSDTEKLEQAERKLSDMHNKLQTSYTGINDKINEYSQRTDEATENTSRLSRIGGMVGSITGALARLIGNLIAQGASEAYQYFEDKIKEAGGNVVDGILLGILDALLGIGSWIVDNVFKPILDGFKNAFGIHSPSTVMQEQGHYIIEGLLLGITDFLSKIKKKFEEIRNLVTEKMDNIKSSAVSKVNEMKKGLSDGVERIKESFRSGFSALVGYVKSPINSIIRFINNFLYAIQTMQNSFANALNSMSISLPHWLEKLTGFSSVGFNVGYWSAPMVPYLAQGAVIPPNKEFMAVLGDQKNGNNIEAPESLIRRIVREESGNNGTQRIEVPVYLNRREIARAVLEEGRCLRTVTGRNPFELI